MEKGPVGVPGLRLQHVEGKNRTGKVTVAECETEEMMTTDGVKSIATQRKKGEAETANSLCKVGPEAG